MTVNLLNQELAAWIRNNWRPYATSQVNRTKIRVNAINIVWETQRAAVEEQIRQILGVEELDPKDERFFQQRTTAAKRVLDGMTELQRSDIKAIVKQRRAQGNPQEVQRE